jgi:hypothetical protein
MARRIRKAQIKFVSLVPKGANLLTPVYKADGSFSVGCLSTATEKFDESGELLNVVYAPEHRDSQGDVADAAVIKDAAYEFVANGAGVDVNHDGKALPRDKARIAETFLVQKSDPRFHGWKDAKGNPVNLEGAWATVIKIDDPDLRKKYRSGEWGGVSMGGTAIVEAEKSESEADGFFAWLRKAFTGTSTQQTQTDHKETMTPEEIKKAVADGIAAGLAAHATAVETQKAADLKKEADAAPKGPVAPIFKGNRANPRDLQLHERALEAFELEKSTDFANSASVKTYREAVAEMRKAWAEEDKEAGIVETTQKRGPSVTNPASPEAGTNAELAKLGAALAETINKSRGLATKEA